MLLQAEPKASPPQQALKRRPLFYVLRVLRHTTLHQNPEQTATVGLASSNTVCTRSTVTEILSENQQWVILSKTQLIELLNFINT